MVCFFLILLPLLVVSFFRSGFHSTDPLRDEEVPVEIVYFINIYKNPDTYHHLLVSQLSDLVSADSLLDSLQGSLWIECCGKDPAFEAHVRSAIPPHLFSRTHITMHEEDNHEYFGMLRVWSLAQHSSSRFLLYFHAKGITHNKFTAENPRDAFGKELLDTVLRPWKTIVALFHQNPHIDKIGYSFSREGWMWYNFWWARASYCRQLEPPVMTKNRYYYEEYLARRPRRSTHAPRSTTETETPLTPENYILSHTNCLGLKIHQPYSPP
jgi:hypothetical protein